MAKLEKYKCPYCGDECDECDFIYIPSYEVGHLFTEWHCLGKCDARWNTDSKDPADERILWRSPQVTKETT